MRAVDLLDDTLPLSQLSEGAFWDRASGTLLWVDILGQRIHTYDLGQRQHVSLATPSSVSFAFPYGENRVIAGLQDGLYQMERSGESRAEPVALLDLPHEHRLNDGQCDPRGRLWVGTICTADDPSATAALYRLENGRLQEVEGGYVNANGKGWSPDGKIMYHADTSRSTIWQYDYDLPTGGLSGKRVFVSLDNASPDGLCVDSQGRVFAALYGGSAVAVFSPRGEMIDRIELPVPNVTSCTFGGDDHRTLFITTAYDGLDPQQRNEFPFSGQIFTTEMDVPGQLNDGLKLV
ncbi:SMP-30/gluconolactonase/LRE family protein [Rhizobium deserti]|uniref:SMP-30/gluconolactonase/LRE family protein n=1 Tax=Rhizobium deserti TaxID=2547961 RepID=A0A4V3ANI0_9HYPH|nr:SMP-30/gluconolactonase/LRE family protein [Rhizobium deserti]TDK31338.1 SMP-30/gluconolactonase/LRE family protein [Rhizobium deserti]